MQSPTPFSTGRRRGQVETHSFAAGHEDYFSSRQLEHGRGRISAKVFLNLAADTTDAGSTYCSGDLQ